LQYEFVEGGTLTGLIKERAEQGKLTAAWGTALILQLAKTMAFAHQHGIVHCDLKPANILVQRDPKGGIILRVADFGIGGIAAGHALRQASRQATSRHELLTEAVRGAYTPLYASPQQVMRRPGEHADPRDDVHALGVIWYQLVTGDLRMITMPPDWQNLAEKKGLSREFLDVLGGCITSQEDERLNDAGKLADRLKKLLSPSLASIPPTTRPEVVLPVPVARLVPQPQPTKKPTNVKPEPRTIPPGIIGNQDTRIQRRPGGLPWYVARPLAFITALVLSAFILVPVVIFFSAINNAKSGGNKDSDQKLGTKEKTDEDKIQGTWVVTSLEMQEKKFEGDDLKNMKMFKELVFSGDQIYSKVEVDKYEATFVLDARKTPKQIDLTETKGENKGKNYKGIYTFDGDDILKLAIGESDRPGGFKTEKDSKFGVVIHKREKAK